MHISSSKMKGVFVMKTVTTILFMLVALTTPGQSQWVLQSPIPTGYHLNGVGLTSPNHIFICGINRTLMESTNGGVSWISRNLAVQNEPFYQVYFSDSEHGYLIGNDFGGESWRTTNGGATWVEMTSVPVGSWYHIDFISPTAGFIGSNGACAFTSNGGISWDLKSGYPNCPVMYGMDFLNAQTGLAAGTLENAEGIFKTTDGGVTWTIKSSFGANDVIWINGNTALAIMGTSVYKSSDTGESWILASSGIATGLIDLERVDANNVAGVSGKGDIWRSTDGGLSWTMVFDGLGDLPARWDISFLDNSNGWVAGQSGTILKTVNGGASWTLISNGIGIQIHDLEMFTDNFGIAACLNGYIFRTTSGGLRWETQKLEVTGQIFGRDEGFRAISIVDSGFAVAAGEGGTVFRTYNGGINWESIGYPVLSGEFFIEDVKFTNRNEGWIVGLDQGSPPYKSVYKTNNGGNTWVPAMSQNPFMTSVDFTDSQHGWIATIHLQYFVTTNGGAEWMQRSLPPYFTLPTVSKMRFFDNNNGWVVGWDGFVARTTDGGNQWTIIDIGTTEDHIFGLSIVSPTEVWMTGREDFAFDGVVYHTTNAGATWTREVVTSFPADVPYTISAKPSGDVWFGGYNGRIFRKTGTTGVQSNNEIPLNFNLHQNYPNPFNPLTKIKFDIPKQSFVKLVIYDLLGREVSVLVNNELKSGRYDVSFDAVNYSSGIYFYKLTAGDFTDTKKMVLMK